MLLFTHAVDRVVHLGCDDALDQALRGWPERLGAPRDDRAFLREVATLAASASPDDLDALLARDARRVRLGAVSCLSGADDRCIEMIEDQVILMVHDKTSLDEEDIANASVVAWGLAPAADLRRIGRRLFVAPGLCTSGNPCAAALVELVDGAIRAALLDRAGAEIRELTAPAHRRAKTEVRAS